MASKSDLPYSSPPRKLIRFFEKSRDQWKAKCQKAKAKVKGLQHRIRYLERSKAEWKARAQRLETQLAHVEAPSPPSDGAEASGAGKKSGA